MKRGRKVKFVSEVSDKNLFEKAPRLITGEDKLYTNDCCVAAPPPHLVSVNYNQARAFLEVLVDNNSSPNRLQTFLDAALGGLNLMCYLRSYAPKKHKREATQTICGYLRGVADALENHPEKEDE